MRNLRLLLGLFIFSIAAIVITWVALNYLGIQHGPFLVKIGFIFILVNVVLYLLLLIFSVIRNLLNLYFEKRQKAIVSKFRTQLVVAFVGLTLVPSILLFILSNQLINNSIDTWFSLEVQKPIYDSMDIAKIYYSQERENAGEYAELLASDTNLLNSPHGDSVTGNYMTFLYTDPAASGSNLIRKAFDGIYGTEIITLDTGDIIRAVSPVKGDNGTSSVVVVEKLIPRDVVLKLEDIKKAYNEFNQVNMQQKPIRFLYFLMLTIATLVIIFAYPKVARSPGFIVTRSKAEFVAFLLVAIQAQVVRKPLVCINKLVIYKNQALIH